MKTITDITRPAALSVTQTNSYASKGKETRLDQNPESSNVQSFGKFVEQATVTIRKGNTLSGITRQWLGKNAENMNPQRFNQLVQLVGKSNGLTDPNRIYVGQVLDLSSLNNLSEGKAISANTIHSPKQWMTDTSALSSTSQKDAPALTTLKTSPGEDLKNLLSANMISTELKQTLSSSPHRVVIVGDSIALGTGGSLLSQKGFIPQYEKGQKSLTQTGQGVAVDATVGLSSSQILKKIQKNPSLQNAEMAVISAGTNDMVGQLANTEENIQKISQNLRDIRANLHANHNVWVLPYNPKASDLVRSVAQEFGDSTVNLNDFAKADPYHPRSYSDIAKTLKLPENIPANQFNSTLSLLQSR